METLKCSCGAALLRTNELSTRDYCSGLMRYFTQNTFKCGQVVAVESNGSVIEVIRCPVLVMEEWRYCENGEEHDDNGWDEVSGEVTCSKCDKLHYVC